MDRGIIAAASILRRVEIREKAMLDKQALPKALVISARVDWDAETANDVMVTFVDGDNPIKEAHEMIDDFETDFPNHEHWIRANDVACQVRMAEIVKRHGWDEAW